MVWFPAHTAPDDPSTMAIWQIPIERNATRAGSGKAGKKAKKKKKKKNKTKSNNKSKGNKEDL